MGVVGWDCAGQVIISLVEFRKDWGDGRLGDYATLLGYDSILSLLKAYPTVVKVMKLPMEYRVFIVKNDLNRHLIDSIDRT